MNEAGFIYQYNKLLLDNFKARLEIKTGWGRVELLQEFQDSVNEAMAKTADMLFKAAKEQK